MPHSGTKKSYEMPDKYPAKGEGGGGGRLEGLEFDRAMRCKLMVGKKKIKISFSKKAIW